MSVNLNNANYCINNKQYTKEEYQSVVERMQNDPNKFNEMKEIFFRMIG
ncbi:MAG: hypothetical protein WCG98_10245 [bacterium]